MKIVIITLFMTIFCGCSSVQKNNHEQMSNDDLKVSVEKKLTSLINEAVKNGEQSKSYLAQDLFLKASYSSMHGDAVTASMLYGYILSLKPNDAYIMKLLGIELVKLGKLDDSQKILQKSFKSKNDYETGIVLAGVDVAMKQYKDARQIYHLLEKSKKSTWEVCLFKQKTYLYENNTRRALSLASSCSRKFKKPDFYFEMAKYKLQEEEAPLDAKKYINQALSVDPLYFPAKYSLVEIYEAEGNIYAAEKILKSMLDKDRDNEILLLKYSEILFDQGRVHEVLPHLEILVDKRPDDYNLQVRLGIIYGDVGELGKAQDVFLKILTFFPNSEKVLYYLGVVFEKDGKTEEAIEYFSRISEESNLFIESQLQIGQLLLTSATKDSTLSDRFISFATKKITNPKLKFPLGMMLTSFYDEADNVDKAIAILATLKNENDYSEDHDYYLASLYERNSMVQKSREIIKKVIEMSPNNPHALNFLGYSILDNDNDLDLAYHYIKRAYDINPNDGYILDSLGWYHFKNGQYKKALSYIKKAKDVVDNDSTVSKHLAMTYEKINNFKEAKKSYLEALSFCRTDSDKKDIQNKIINLQSLFQDRLPASR